MACLAKTIACCSADTIGAVCCRCRRAIQRCRRWSPPFPYCLFGIHLSLVATCFCILLFTQNAVATVATRCSANCFILQFEQSPGFFPQAGRRGRVRDEQRRKKQAASSMHRDSKVIKPFLPRQSSATKTITGIRSHGTERALSFIAELIGNGHGKQQWICVLFG